MSAADTLWWQQFGDPVLDGLIAEALEHNSNIAIAVANVEQASALLTQTRSQLYPQVGYGATAQRQRTVEPAFASLLPNYPNPSDAYQALLSASWEIDLWGRIRRQSESALANLLATDEARRDPSVVASVANSYLQLRGPGRPAGHRAEDARGVRRVGQTLHAAVQSTARSRR